MYLHEVSVSSTMDCEEETVVHTGISWQTSKLVHFLQIFKFVYFAPKKICAFKKNP